MVQGFKTALALAALAGGVTSGGRVSADEPATRPAGVNPEPGAAAAKTPLLVGVYQLTGGEKYGQPIPAGRIKGGVVTITEDTITVVDKDEKQLYVTRYEATSTDEADTRTVKLTSQVPEGGGTAEGLIRIRVVEEGTGDGKMKSSVSELWLIYALPGGEAPTSFETKEKQLMFKMERKAKPAGVSGGAKPQE